ncbi:MAG: alanine racemase, partial [Pseudomonadota bacterium]
MTAPEVGYDVPAAIGMDEAEIQTPALILDLDVMEQNLAAMAASCRALGVDVRPHGKAHKTPELALRQIAHGAVGICCQKVSEAEAFVRGGVEDVLVANEVSDPQKIDRLARLARMAAVAVCVDDAAAVADLSRSAVAHGAQIRVLVEIDAGSGRCGVRPGDAAVALAQAVADAPGLSFGGIQAYNGSNQ